MLIARIAAKKIFTLTVHCTFFWDAQTPPTHAAVKVERGADEGNCGIVCTAIVALFATFLPAAKLDGLWIANVTLGLDSW